MSDPCLCYMSLSHVLDNYIQLILYIYNISQYICDIRIFYLPIIGICIGSKIPISVGPEQQQVVSQLKDTVSVIHRIRQSGFHQNEWYLLNFFIYLFCYSVHLCSRYFCHLRPFLFCFTGTQTTGTERKERGKGGTLCLAFIVQEGERVFTLHHWKSKYTLRN